MRERSEQRPEDQRGGRLPERETEGGDAQHPDEHGGELEVGRGPGPQELEGLPVPLLQRDELSPARLDSGQLAAVLALADFGNDLDLVFGSRQCRHARAFLG